MALDGAPHVEVKECDISENGQVGMFGAGEASLSVEDSHINGNMQAGLILAEEASAVIGSSEFSLNSESGLYAGDDTHVEVRNSSILNTPKVGVSLHGSATAVLQGCTVSQNYWGVAATASAQVEIQGCLLSGNAWCGLEVSGTSVVDLWDTTIERSEAYGITAVWPGCYEELGDLQFAGQITGGGNLIPGPDAPNGNALGACCPEYPGEPWPAELILEQQP